MDVILQSITIAGVVSGLIIIVSIILLRAVIKRDTTFILRWVVIFLFLLLSLVVLQRYEIHKIPITQVKDLIFPPEDIEFTYKMEEGSMRGRDFTRYIFEKPKPRLRLTLDKSGEFFHMSDVPTLNKILTELGLQTVAYGVPELFSITGRNADIYQFQWDDYPGGILIVERDMCREGKDLRNFHCLNSITILSRF